MPKQHDFINLEGVSKKIVKAYIIGKSTSFFGKQIEKNVVCTVSKNLKIAIQNIYIDIKRDKNLKNTILLSPAAASFDQFSSFEERGNYFKNLVVKKFNV